MIQRDDVRVMNPDEVLEIHFLHNGFHGLMHDEFSGDGINDDIIFHGINPDNFIEVELDIFVIDHS